MNQLSYISDKIGGTLTAKPTTRNVQNLNNNITISELAMADCLLNGILFIILLVIFFDECSLSGDQDFYSSLKQAVQ